VILGHSYSTQIDVWSAAVTLYELATGKSMFSGETNNEMMHQMLKELGAIPQKFATGGEFSSKHFNKGGDFLNANGDYAIDSKNPAVVPMTTFQLAERPIPKLLEANLPPPPAGADPLRHQGLVRHFGDLLEQCLVMTPAQRLMPEAVLSLRFFEKGA